MLQSLRVPAGKTLLGLLSRDRLRNSRTNQHLLAFKFPSQAFSAQIVLIQRYPDHQDFRFALACLSQSN